MKKAVRRFDYLYMYIYIYNKKYRATMQLTDRRRRLLFYPLLMMMNVCSFFRPLFSYSIVADTTTQIRIKNKK